MKKYVYEDPLYRDDDESSSTRGRYRTAHAVPPADVQPQRCSPAPPTPSRDFGPFFVLHAPFRAVQNKQNKTKGEVLFESFRLFLFLVRRCFLLGFLAFLSLPRRLLLLVRASGWRCAALCRTAPECCCPLPLSTCGRPRQTESTTIEKRRASFDPISPTLENSTTTRNPKSTTFAQESSPMNMEDSNTQQSFPFRTSVKEGFLLV